MSLDILWTPGENDGFDETAYNQQVAEIKTKLDRILAVVDGESGIEFDNGFGISHAEDAELGAFHWAPTDTNGAVYAWTGSAATSNTDFHEEALPVTWPGLGCKAFLVRVVAYNAVNLRHPRAASGYAASYGRVFRSGLLGLAELPNQGVHLFAPPPYLTAGWSPGAIPVRRNFVCLNDGDVFQVRHGTNTGGTADYYQMLGYWS